ncbi:MAG: hypothetical protein VX527_11260 [Planctomycetota bacterium]|nr:hypothetical protein [Planctomycetota bacterium]
MRMRLARAGLYLQDCHTRLPFRFGMHTLTSAPLGTLHVHAIIEGGGTIDGYASDLLVPKWFEKNPNKTPQEDVQALIDSANHAINTAIDLSSNPQSVFDLWYETWNECLKRIPIDAPDRLVHGWGPSLIERALIDAACRASAMPFHKAMRTGLLEFDAGRLDNTLANWSPDNLPEPRTSIALRHTVGLADAIRPADVETPVNDGLPECLQDDIDANGLTHFKIKVGGKTDEDIQRVLEVADVIFSRVQSPVVTLDGNEQYDSMSSVAQLLEGLSAHDNGKRLLQHLCLIEQPLSRSITFESGPNQGIERVSSIAPVIIDEADGDPDALSRAAALGYGGVSAKNCKGVFRALLNQARCAASQGSLLLSAEDLTTLPIIALQQDLATAATLGLDHIERNGHHYFHGLDHLPGSEVAEALERHGGLYEQTPAGAQLRIQRGSLALESLDCAGFGYAVAPDLSKRVPAGNWSWSEDE